MQTTSDSIASKSKSTNKSSIKKIIGGKIIIEVNIVNPEFRMRFFSLGAKLAFTKLRHAFNTTLILQYFDLKCHIWIETDASRYAISGICSQLTSDGSG